MKTLIVEDEPRAASQLQRMLNTLNFEHELLAIIDSIEDAVQWFESQPSPDLVFMDIQLADGLSFEIFQKTQVDAPIIFTTAFDQYAIQAFKVNSVDYLLKPIQKTDLEQALSKFMKTTNPAAIDPGVVKQLLDSMQKTQKREGILVKDGNGFSQLRVSELLYCYSEESVTFGVTANKRYIINETLDELFDSLDPRQFFKINRGQMVSKTAILKIQPYFNHRVKLSLAHSRDQEFVVSRPKTNSFKEWLNQ